MTAAERVRTKMPSGSADTRSRRSGVSWTVGPPGAVNIANLGEGVLGRGRLAGAVSRKVWPLAALTLGLPVWWALGLGGLAPILLAVPMAAQLLRARPVRLPAGFGWWLLFLAWVVLGLAVLWVDAPGAVPGQGGGSRLLVFGLRLSWYVACTVALLWVTNLDRLEVPDRTIHRLVAVLFVVATAGGLLGVLAPTLEFRSAVELVLPGGIRGNPFVTSLVHPETADVQHVLGVPERAARRRRSPTRTRGGAASP